MRRRPPLWALILATLPVFAFAAPAAGSFEVTIALFLKGTYRKTAHTVTAQRIRKVDYALADGKAKTVFERKLQPAEAAAFSAFLSKLPLAKLKPRYASNTRGDGHLIFDIRVGAQKKSVYVYFFKQPDLWQLAKRINALLPAEHAVFYGRDDVDD